MEIAKAAVDLGYWGMSFIEHHLHPEGFELGPCPGVMNARRYDDRVLRQPASR